MTPEEFKELEACYETLGIPLRASPEEIRTAYRRLAQPRRPDGRDTTGRREDEDAGNRMQAVHDAYERVKAAPLRYHVPYKGESTSGEWNPPREPSEDFIRANLALSEATPHRHSAWNRIERRLQNEPLAFILLGLGALQMVWGLAYALSWETLGLSWGDMLSYEHPPFNRAWRLPLIHPARYISSGLVASIGAAAVLAMPRYRLWLFWSLAVAQGLIMNLWHLWLLLGVLSAVAMILQFGNDSYSE